MNYQQVEDVVHQLSSSSPKEVYKSLLEIRKKCPISTSGVKLLVDYGLVTTLLQIIATSKSFSDETVVRIVDIAVSILSNVCMEAVARKEVLRDKHALEVFVKLIATVGVESLQVRCCRCIANLTMTPASWEPLHRTPVVKAIVRLLERTENQECTQTCIRALRLLGQTGSHVDKLLDENAVCAVMKYIDDITTATSSSAVRCIASLTIHRCSPKFASQVISSTKHAHLLTLISHTDPETSTHALHTLIHLTDNYNYRPVFGNIGGIETFANLLRSEDSVTKPHVLTMRPPILTTLCLCCEEAVNRVKLREHDVLEIFLQSLRNDEYEVLHSRIISALACYLYDSPSLDIMLEKGLVSVLVNQLNAYMDSASVFPIEQLSDSEDHDADSVVVEDECIYTESETAMNVRYKKLLSSPRGKKRKKIPGPNSVFEKIILVLLSCVKQLPNPTNYFVTMETIMCLLDYIICMDEPKARAAIILSRVFRNPHCFTKLVQLNIPIIVYERLLDKENFNSLRCLLPLKPTCKRRPSTVDDKASVSSESERFSLTDDSFSVDHQASKRCRISSTFVDSSICKDGKQPIISDVQSQPPSTSKFGASAAQYKGVYHKQGDAVCCPVRCGVAFLEDLSGVADSSFGRGLIERLLYTADEEDKLDVCLCMLFILREIESRRCFLKDIDYCIMLYKIRDLLEDSTMRMTLEFQIAVMGLSYLVMASGLPAQLQNLQKEAIKAFMEKIPLNELNADSGNVGNEVANTREKSEQQNEGNQEAMEGFMLKVPPNELNDGSGNMGNEVANTKGRSEEETSGNQEASTGLSDTPGVSAGLSDTPGVSAGLSDTPGVSVKDSPYEMEPSVCKIEYLHKDVHATYNKTTDHVNELETRTTENCRVNQSLLACSKNKVIFIVDGKKIPSSRAILSESSEVFSALLQGHYNEAVLSEIPIRDSSAVAFEVIVHYLHSCDRTCRVLADFFYNTVSLKSVETCIQVLIESDMYFVHDLKLLAQEMLIGELLNGESAFIILQYAILHDDTILQKAAVGMMLTGAGTRQCKVRRFCKVLDSDFCQPFLQLISNMCTQ